MRLTVLATLLSLSGTVAIACSDGRPCDEQTDADDPNAVILPEPNADPDPVYDNGREPFDDSDEGQ